MSVDMLVLQKVNRHWAMLEQFGVNDITISFEIGVIQLFEILFQTSQ